jgi:glycosyltransferase involved in cell wall biosynthesis
LADQNHQVTLVCSAATDDKTIEENLGAAVRLVPLATWNRALARGLRQINRLAGRPIRGHADIVRALHNFRFALIARAAARELKPDFIYERYSLWGMSGLWLARKLGIPLVLEVNAPLVYEQQQYRAGLTCPPLARWVERHVWQGADLVIAVSESLRGQLQRSVVDPRRIQVLPNAVDPRLFQGDSTGSALRENLNLDGHFTVGFVGTFRPWHGVDLLLATFQDLHRIDPKTHLLLVGEGPLRSRFEEQVRNAGLEKAVTFAGRIAHQEVPKYLAAMDVTVAPYPALDEFYYSPIKLFEYMAAGRAVVASRVGQVAEILIDGQTGFLFEPGDSADLLRCLLQVKADPTLSLELGRRASASCSEHTWNRNASRVIDWVGPLLNRIGSPMPSIREEKIGSEVSRKQRLQRSEGEGRP